MIIKLVCNGKTYHIDSKDALDLQSQGVSFAYDRETNIGNQWTFNDEDLEYHVASHKDYVMNFLKNTGKYNSQFEPDYENIEEEIQALEKKLAELKEKQAEANKVEITYGDAIVSDYGNYYFIMKKPGVGKPVGLRIDSDDFHCLTWVDFLTCPDHFKFIKVNNAGQALEQSQKHPYTNVRLHFPD